MKRTGFISFMLALLALVGCTTPFRPWSLSELREGMDREQVVAILGEPDAVEQQADTLYLHYTYNENYSPSTAGVNTAFVDLDPTLQEFEAQQNLQVYHYTVKLVDGKMQAYKELQDEPSDAPP